MSLVRWSKFLETGNTQIDEEHQVLVERLNDLYACTQEEFDQEKCHRVFHDLMDYTQYHFRREEEMMVNAGYADFPQHKELHDQFTSYIAEAHDALKKDGKAPVSGAVEYLTDWLIDHIKKVDVNFVATISYGVDTTVAGR